MKVYLFFILLFINTALISQSIILLEQDSVSEIYQGIDISNNFEEFGLDLFFKNNTNESIAVNWKRTFGNNCPLEWDILVSDQFYSYTSDINESQQPLTLSPSDSNFIVRQVYYPRMIPGCCDISIIFSLEEDPETPIDTGYYHIEINADGCITTSIYEFSDVNIDIFPNPTRDFINIESSVDIYSIELHDIHGRLYNKVKRQSQESNRIDLTDFDAGVYYCRIISKNGSILTRKFIKV